MEPFTVFLGVGLVLHSALKLGRLANRLALDRSHHGDSKLKAARARLYTETGKLERWKSCIESDGGWDVLNSRLSPDERDAIQTLVNDGEEMMSEAQKRFSRIEASMREKDQMRRIVATYKWRFTEERETLHDAIEALHAINEALERIVQTPPQYSHHRPGGGGSRDSRSNQRARQSRHQSADENEGEAPREQSRVLPDSGQRTLQSLHTAAMAGLRSVSQQGEDSHSFEELTARLKSWGEVLFGPLALDILLQQRLEDEVGDIRLSITTILVDILFVEERLLEDIVPPEDTVAYENRSMRQTEVNVISALGQDEVLSIVTGRSCMIPAGVDRPTLFARASAKIEGAIEDLYEMLPAVRSLRRQHMLILQFQKAAQVSPEPAKETENTTTELLQAAIDEGSGFVAGGSLTLDLEKIAAKEIELLQEYKVNRVSGLGPDDRRIVEECLQKFVQSFARGAPPAQKSATDSTGKGKAGLSDEDSKAFIEALQELNSELPRPD